MQKLQSDDELMNEIAKGNHPAFTHLFKRHSGKVLGYAKRLLVDQSKAEDVSQEVWLKVVKVASNYRGSGNFIAWVFTLTRNAAFNVLRDQKRWVDRHTSFSPDEEEMNEPLWSKGEWEKRWEQMNQIEKVKIEIDCLPDAQRIALVTWLTEDMSYEEVAAQLEVSVSALKSLLFRARQNLNRALGVKE